MPHNETGAALPKLKGTREGKAAVVYSAAEIPPNLFVRVLEDISPYDAFISRYRKHMSNDPFRHDLEGADGRRIGVQPRGESLEFFVKTRLPAVGFREHPESLVQGYLAVQSARQGAGIRGCR